MAEPPPTKTIAALTFDVFRGMIQPAGNTGDRISYPGTDYESWRLLGLHAGESQIATIKACADATAAAAEVASEMALQFTSVTIVDAHGISHAGCWVAAVVSMIQSVIRNGAAVKLVRTVWTVVAEA